MKYIKQFENKTYPYDQYWLIPTDDRFEDSLIKIKCPPERISTFLKNVDNVDIQYPYNKYIFVGYENRSIGEHWGWNNFKGKLHDDYYENFSKCIYMGTVNIDDSDLDILAIKYNI